MAIQMFILSRYTTTIIENGIAQVIKQKETLSDDAKDQDARQA